MDIFIEKPLYSNQSKLQFVILEETLLVVLR